MLNDARSARTGSDAGRVALLATIAWLVLSGGALAQSANVNRYSAAPLPQDGFALSGAEVGEHLGFSASLHLDYADDPLIYEDVRGRSNTELVSLVHSQLTAHAAFALGLYD